MWANLTLFLRTIRSWALGIYKHNREDIPTCTSSSDTKPSPLVDSTPSISSPPAPPKIDLWFYPPEIANDIPSIDLPPAFIAEALTTAWEYTRCIIPHYTNWARIIAFTRLIAIGAIAEFRGDLIDATTPNTLVLNTYNLDDLLSTVFSAMGPAILESMSREFRCFLLITSHKTSQSSSELFHRYVTAIAVARSPKTWFRLRDCDALARFAMCAALACNDITSCDAWFSEPELQLLTELCDTMYDAATYYKHRAEGETNSTFGYVCGRDDHEKVRVESYKRCREVVWALDTAWCEQGKSSAGGVDEGVNAARRCVVNLIRTFGGPIHLMMRRYRFVEDGLTVGIPETDAVVAQTRVNVKLWNRLDSTAKDDGDVDARDRQQQVRRRNEESLEKYADVIRRSDTLLIEGLAEQLEAAGDDDTDNRCEQCKFRVEYGAESAGRFGGVELCGDCRVQWREYIESLPSRAAQVFPVLGGLLL
ncbi:hypothetical protein B0T17DRAFT_512404 [Bombardia bombarda]|uniref:Uncharacterized protein n=1 Tax=Bombardia bombarda TaxID=252184 RepID=A0AA39TW75_9PEZI|nr:hypothetical protein B0T17DRAFT_512404 [Bombardia bombarda]